MLFVLYISGEGLEEDEFVDVGEFWLVRKNRGQEMTAQCLTRRGPGILMKASH